MAGSGAGDKDHSPPSSCGGEHLFPSPPLKRAFERPGLDNSIGYNSMPFQVLAIEMPAVLGVVWLGEAAVSHDNSFQFLFPLAPCLVQIRPYPEFIGPMSVYLAAFALPPVSLESNLCTCTMFAILVIKVFIFQASSIVPIHLY